MFNSSSDTLLITIFAPLIKLDSKLPERIANYIINGEDIDLLTELPHKTNGDYLLINKPFGNSSRFYNRIESLAARENFYRYWSVKYTFEQLIRFGKILAIMDVNHNNFHAITPKVPLWFICLLEDSLVITLYDTAKKSNLLDRNNWSVNQLHLLLELEEQGLGKNLLFAIFDRQNINEYQIDYWQNVFQFQDLLPYIIENIEWFKLLPKNGLSNEGQLQQLQYIARQPQLKQQVVDFIIQQSVNDSKKVSDLATTLLMTCPIEQLQNQLNILLTNGTSKQRIKAATLLARFSSDRLILEHALENETEKKVIHAIEEALARIDSTHKAKQQSTLVIPDFEPLVDVELPELAREILQQNYQDQLLHFQQKAEQEINDNKIVQYQSTYQQARYKKLLSLTSDDLDNIYQYINGKNSLNKSIRKKNIDEQIDFILYRGRLQELSEFNLFHLLRIHQFYNPSQNIYSLVRLLADKEIANEFDLRQLVDVMSKIGYDDPQRTIAICFLANYLGLTTDNISATNVWPFFAEHSEFIDEAFDLLPRRNKSPYLSFDKENAIYLLTKFPILPSKYVAFLLELALGEARSLRSLAQQALSVIPDIQYDVIKALSSTKQEIRITAANWLANLGDQSFIKPLNDALSKEKKEIVQAAFLIALDKLGDDIRIHLTPEKLLLDAKKGLQAKKTTNFEWFNENLVPSLTWQNDEVVCPEIVQWWIRLAFKLKDPGNLLISLYIQQLSKLSQQKLGQFILEIFIKQDTLSPTIEEAEAEVEQYAAQRLQHCLNNYKHHPDWYPMYENITLEKVAADIRREVLGRYNGSAINAKGILALCSGIEGAIAVNLLQSFMKTHYTRRFQIEAMLEGIANSDEPQIIQLLLSIARRHRTNSIQEKAKLLVEKIAQRNQWTADELADRTIATAGLNDAGELSLDYGQRIFTATLDDTFKWVLKNSDGKEIKSLPDARKDEDETLVKEVKKRFSNCKKELKQLLTMQIARLYEAMCTQRRWSIVDWKKYLQAHPIMNQLIQRLIWLEIDSQGNVITSFRPTEDGSLINAEDDEIELNDTNYIILAHCALLAESGYQQWQTHFKDYKVKPLFAQFTHQSPDITLVKNDLIEDHKGWLTDTFTIRGILTKLGYKRSDIEDGGSFDCYYKYFASLNLSIYIQFSGSFVPEENIPAILYNVHFCDNQGWKSKLKPINDVPPVLLAEGYADYMAVADASSGFDPEWEKKGLW